MIDFKKKYAAITLKRLVIKIKRIEEIIQINRYKMDKFNKEFINKEIIRIKIKIMHQMVIFTI